MEKFFLLFFAFFAQGAEIKQEVALVVNIEVEFRRFTEKSGWYISFFSQLDKFLEEHPEIKLEGKFAHENYGGFSYPINLAPHEEKILLETLSGKSALGIWDYVACKSFVAKLQQGKNMDIYNIVIKNIDKCRFISDD